MLLYSWIRLLRTSLNISFQAGRRNSSSKRKRSQQRFYFPAECLEVRSLLSATPIISEFLAANSGGLQDADGDSSDWIEIYNPSASQINLAGWTLTDSASDLNQWAFPAITIDANQFLTIFASGKDRTTGPELHTNFRLSASGEYLALVNPLGTVVSEFRPSFPAQVDNISYGVAFDTTRLIETGASAQILVPQNGLLGSSWTSTSFAPSGWASGTTGIGFGVVQPGFNVTYVKSNTYVDNLDVAKNVLSNPSMQSQTVYSNAPVVNYLGNGGSGNFGDDVAYPTQTIGEDIDDFIVQASGTVTIPSTGSWTFGVNSDDGFELRLERNGVVFTTQYFDPRGASDTLATFNIPEAGNWNLTLIAYERGGGASVEMFAAQGAFNSFGEGSFHLVGDSSGGGLTAFSTIGNGSSVAVGTDIGAAMLGVNPSVYVRIPFTVTDPSAFDSLILKMAYDDGFVAYLNGVEVARRNSPTTPQFDSEATIDRDVLAATTSESINLTPFLAALRAGDNVLAIQGMNSSYTDDSLLILPQLTGSKVHLDEVRYFSTPTPGDPNINPALGVVERVSANVPAGFYSAPISVELATPTAGAEIRYTVDGSTPTATNGFVYAGPVTISSTTTLRAGAFVPDYISLPTMTRSYLFLDDVIHQSPSDDVAGGDPDMGAPPTGWPNNWGNNIVDYGMDQTVVDQEGADRIKAALLSIPTISITTDLANLFDPITGIYSNAYNDGRDWERPASMELLNPDGTPGFQVNAGLRVRGGYSRSGDNPKHAFRLFFRGEYGDSSLDYPLFGSEGTNSFKKIDLRTAQNYSWSFGGDPNNTMIQDVFNRDSQGAMGQPYTRSRPYHLYIDGQYWGLYETEERPEAEYAASYFGGSAVNYDVIKPEAGSYTNYATDGNMDAYFQLWQAVTTQNLSDNAVYFHLQGKDANGIDDPSIPNEDVLLDVDNLVVFMLGILQSGNLDSPISAFLGNEGINNYFAIRDRTGRAGFKYIQHDGEHTLHNIYEDRNGPFPAGQTFDRFNPQFLHQQLMANPEYRLKFADAVQKFFFNDGAMTAAATQARFQARADQLNLAILAESARWGDSKRPTSPLGYNDWLGAVNQVIYGFLANRNPILLDQFRSNGLFPQIGSPQFLINGVPQDSGQVTLGSLMRFSANQGIVYYTTNGEDPRLVGGGLNPDALSYDPGASTTTLLGAGSNWKYFDQGTDLGTTWRQSVYDDSQWSSGNAELGYGDGDEATVVGFGPNAAAKFITTYFRSSFQVPDLSAITGLRLRLKRDDGAVVYINGVEATRSNMPGGTIAAATLATGPVGDADEATYYEIEISPGLLLNGINSIAIEVHQSSGTSSDLSFDAELLAVSQANPGLIINSSTHVVARAFDGLDWSPVSTASFSTAVPAAAGNLAVTEIHYNPAAMPGATTAPFNDKDNFEFIELKNIGTETINLSSVKFTVGITFDFSTGDVVFLEPGQHIVVVKNLAAFEARYGTEINVAGVYSGNLNNGGEQIVLVDANGTTIQDFTYDDDLTTTPPWPASADGGGYSLTVRNPSGNDNLPSNWRASYLLHGTPGYEENDYPANLALSSAVVSENLPNGVVGILTATDPNPGDNISFSLVPGADSALFVIVGNELRVGSTGLDYEAGSTRTVTVRATDSGGLFVDKTFTITVTDVVEAELIGTSGSDVFLLTYISANLVSVIINGQSMGTVNSSQFALDGLGGDDTLSILGSQSGNSWTFGSAFFDLNQIRINYQNFESFQINGGAGTDILQVVGSVGNDTVAITGALASTVVLNGFSVQTLMIDQYAFDGVGGNDVLTAPESVGNISLIVTLSAPAIAPLFVPFSQGGSAVDSVDYNLSTSPLQIDAGQTRGQINLSVIDDVLGEINETLSVTPANPANASLAAPISYTVVIVDNDPPESHVLPLPQTLTTTTFPISWSGTADAAQYDVYVSDNGGPFTRFVVSSTSLSANFTGQFGHSYAFYSVAIDNDSNVESSPLVADAYTTLVQPFAPTVVSPTVLISSTTSAKLGATVSSDGNSGIVERGVVYSLTSVNSNPQLGGAGVTRIISSGTTGMFTVNALGLTNGAVYSFAAYAINGIGTTYTSPASIFGVNLAPVIKGIESTPLSYKANDPAFPPLAISNSVALTDPDSDNLSKLTIQITSGYQNDANGHDVLAFTSKYGITGAFDAATGTLTLSGSSYVGNYREALRSVTFRAFGPAVSSANRVLTIIGYDGGLPTPLVSQPVTRTVAVLTTNIGPAVNGVPGDQLSYVQGTTAVVVAPSLTISDPDSINLLEAQIQITGNYQNGLDVLRAVTTGTGITQSFNSSTGTLLLLGVSSLANYQSVLRSVTFHTTSKTGSTALRTVTFLTNDGLAQSAPVTRNIQVTPFIFAPQVGGIESTPLVYKANTTALPISNSVTVIDQDSNNLTRLTVQITSGYQNDTNGKDVLSFTNKYGITGSFDATTGTLTLSGSAYVGYYREALRTVTFRSTGTLVNNANRTLTIIATDDGSPNTSSSLPVTRTIALTLAPVISEIETSRLEFHVNDAPLVISNTVEVTDPDSNNLTKLTVQITSGYQNDINGRDVLSFINKYGITGSFDAVTGTLTLSGNVYVGYYREALRTVTYRSSGSNISTADRILTMIATDDSVPNPVSSQIATRTIASINRAPVVSNIEATALVYNANDPFKAITSTATITDADSSKLSKLTVQITSGYQNDLDGHDVLAFANVNGITGSFNAATGTLTLTGNAYVGYYREALRSITFRASGSNVSKTPRILTIIATDDGSPNPAISLAVTRSINVG